MWPFDANDTDDTWPAISQSTIHAHAPLDSIFHDWATSGANRDPANVDCSSLSYAVNYGAVIVSVSTTRVDQQYGRTCAPTDSVGMEEVSLG